VTNQNGKIISQEIFRHVMSADVIFGKQLFLLAEKDPAYQKGI
jgi:hypothetical protein